MASLFLNQPKLIAPTSSLPPSFRTPIPANPAQGRTNNARRLVPCRAASDGRAGKRPEPRPAEKLDRRDVLLGLGGLAGLGSSAASALDQPCNGPIVAPKQEDCHHPTDLPPGVSVECCPPKPKNETKYFKPSHSGKLRVRQPAQDLDAETIAKYKKATELMRALPDDDPRSFTQQAKVHCAYCNDGYYQVGFETEKINIQVHSSWLFFPFHRWQLYFYEKILGKLIDDPTFALPFWNWDSPPGMYMPDIYTDRSSSLYNVDRNPLHQPPVVADLKYDQGIENRLPPDQLIKDNLSIMYRQMICYDNPVLFMGKRYCAGDKPNPGVGSLENTPHNNLHTWGGNYPTRPNNEDLGNFYSAGNDPLFYALHSNVDRLWDIWKKLPGGNRKDFVNPNWRNASFAFYDENAERVEVLVGDAVDIGKLGYEYKDVPLPWLNAKPKPFRKKAAVSVQPRRPLTAKERVSTRPSDFPLTLERPLSVVVPRPKRRRSKKEKEDQAEVLEIEGIEFDKTLSVSFDVYVNDEDDTVKIGPENTEFVGQFSTVSSGGDKDKNKKISTSISLPLTEALEDLDVEDDDTVVVTLVPRSGIGKVKIGGIKIDLLTKDEF